MYLHLQEGELLPNLHCLCRCLSRLLACGEGRDYSLFPAAYFAAEPAIVEALDLVLGLGPPTPEVALRSPVPLQAGLRHL
jgi:hypothetical protein